MRRKRIRGAMSVKTRVKVLYYALLLVIVSFGIRFWFLFSTFRSEIVVFRIVVLFL